MNILDNPPPPPDISYVAELLIDEHWRNQDTEVGGALIEKKLESRGHMHPCLSQESQVGRGHAQIKLELGGGARSPPLPRGYATRTSSILYAFLPPYLEILAK